MTELSEALLPTPPAGPGDNLRGGEQGAGRGPEESDEQPPDLGDGDRDVDGAGEGPIGVGRIEGD